MKQMNGYKIKNATNIVLGVSGFVVFFSYFALKKTLQNHRHQHIHVMFDEKSIEILEFIEANPSLSSKGIHEGLNSEIGYSTVKRILSRLINENLILPKEKGRARKYIIAPAYKLFHPVDIDKYFQKEIDER